MPSRVERPDLGGHVVRHPAALLLLGLLLQGTPFLCAAQSDTRTSPIDSPEAQSPMRDPSKEGAIDVLVRQGTTARREGKLEMAIKLFSAARQLAPERYEVHIMLADTLRRTGRAGEAKRSYDEAISRDPTRPEAYLGQVLIRWDEFNYTTALAIGQQALERVAAEGRAVILANLAETQRRREQIREASTWLWRAPVSDASPRRKVISTGRCGNGSTTSGCARTTRRRLSGGRSCSTCAARCRRWPRRSSGRPVPISWWKPGACGPWPAMRPAPRPPTAGLSSPTRFGSTRVAGWRSRYATWATSGAPRSNSAAC
jgi:hypothetical protein